MEWMSGQSFFSIKSLWIHPEEERLIAHMKNLPELWTSKNKLCAAHQPQKQNIKKGGQQHSQKQKRVSRLLMFLFLRVRDSSTKRKKTADIFGAIARLGRNNFILLTSSTATVNVIPLLLAGRFRRPSSWKRDQTRDQ